LLKEERLELAQAERAERGSLAAPSRLAGRPWWRCTSTKALSALLQSPPPPPPPCSSGEQIITQGETGATFYIMFSGTVNVYKAGSCQASMQDYKPRCWTPLNPL